MKKIFAIEERDHHTLNLIFDEGVRVAVQKTDGPFAVGDMYGEPELVIGVLAEDVVGIDESGNEVELKAGEEVMVDAAAITEVTPPLEPVVEPKGAKKK